MPLTKERSLASAALLLSASLGMGQSVPNAGLTYLENVQISGWSTKAAGFDLFAFNPRTLILYIGDRTNHAVTAIDARTNTAVGVMPIPGNPSTNGVLVAPDLEQLVATDNKTNVWVWDLRLPGDTPDQYALPNIGGGTDALDYDPLNQTVYVINGKAPYYITGISLADKTVTSQLELPGSPELMRFNPVDGMIYQVITDSGNHNKGAGVVAYDPVSNTIKNYYLTPNCVPHGIEIDPVVNGALLGCGTNQGQLLMNLADGTTIATFPDVTGSDLLTWNPNLRRFYTGSGSNVSTTTGCPSDSSKHTPVMGVIEARATGGVVKGALVGVVCTGRASHGLGVDPLRNFVYVGATQYPVNASDSTTGQAGVLTFLDPAPPVQGSLGPIQVTMDALPGSSTSGSFRTALLGRHLELIAGPITVSGTSARIVVTTTVGNESVECATDPAGKSAVCNGPLVGDPMLGAPATLVVDDLPVARGTIVAPPAQ